jgi:hypothetical protein
MIEGTLSQRQIDAAMRALCDNLSRRYGGVWRAVPDDSSDTEAEPSGTSTGHPDVGL